MACPYFLLSRSIFQATSNRSRSSKPVSLFYPCRSSVRRPLPQIPQGHPRVAKRAPIGTLARRPSTEALLGQGRVAKGRESVPLTGLRSGSRPCSARHPRLQVVLRMGRVTKWASIGTLARGPSTEALLRQGRVTKGRESVPLTGLWSVLRPG